MGCVHKHEQPPERRDVAVGPPGEHDHLPRGRMRVRARHIIGHPGQPGHPIVRCFIRDMLRDDHQGQGRFVYRLFKILIKYVKCTCDAQLLTPGVQIRVYMGHFFLDPTRPAEWLTLPYPTRPYPTRPDLTRFDPTRLDPTRPDPTRPDQTRPDPTGPDP